MVIERVQDAPAVAMARIEPMVEDYLAWAGAQQVARGRIPAASLPPALERVHANVRADLPQMLSVRGQLLVARVEGADAGLVALKPIDAATGELKRMWVDPARRGGGVARALLAAVIDAARRNDYLTVRLETADFMAAAHALYRAAGFRDVPPFGLGEAEQIGLHVDGMHFMELRLR